jgi:hypothetical protein
VFVHLFSGTKFDQAGTPYPLNSMGIGSGKWADVGDVTGDGREDLLVAENRSGGPDHLWLLAQNDAGTLETAKSIHTFALLEALTSAGQVAVADVNLDGRKDVAVTSDTFDMWIFLQSPAGLSGGRKTDFPTAATIVNWALAVGDVDCDGCPDVIGSQVWRLVVFPGLGCAR